MKDHCRSFLLTQYVTKCLAKEDFANTCSILDSVIDDQFSGLTDGAVSVLLRQCWAAYRHPIFVLADQTIEDDEATEISLQKCFSMAN